MLDKHTYIGRFAPSPTGPLHFGSLYTALASFLAARAQQGLWRLRIDDLDTPRNRKGSIDSILTTLDAFGLHWDGTIAHQSQTIGLYHEILGQLAKDQRVYPCTCSRKDLASQYPCTCRDKPMQLDSPHSLRIKTDNRVITFKDGVQGLVSQNLAQDFILKRKDQIIAYQFAVVIDDDRQHISHIVRGHDLLEPTPKQIYLQQILGLLTPRYLHVPIITDEQGYKLSKQTRATAVDLKQIPATLFELLTLLKQDPPRELQGAPPIEQLSWAIAHWQPNQLKHCPAICRVTGQAALARQNRAESL